MMPEVVLFSGKTAKEHMEEEEARRKVPVCVLE